MRFLCCFGLVWLWSGVVWAVPGPDSVVVVANKNDMDSLALAQKYAKAREIPPNQICLLDLPQQEDISKADYLQKFVTPLEQCMTQGGVTARIEAVVLMRGVPLRVTITNGGQSQRASLAAALGAWKSTSNGKSILDEMPGQQITCSGGSTCLAARWSNPFRSGIFRPGYQKTVGTVDWKPLLVTMLHGRSYMDAEKLLTSAIDAEKTGGAKGQFLLMKGSDAARGRLDTEYTSLETQLKARGWTDVVIENFNRDLTGRSLAAFFVGTAGLGTTIEGNTYLPGSVTDNLTSFGAVPTNFRATGQSQVSIARWVAQGVAGAHGTTDEPLNNCFPSRNLLLDYVDGSTLAEAYHRRLPYVYWRNLVLGDPMTAPYAKRPKVTISAVKAGDKIAGSRKVKVQATDPGGRGIESIALFVDGKEVGRSNTASLEVCIDVAVSAEIQILAVAQAKPKTGTTAYPGQFQPKGWTAIRVEGLAGPQGCRAVEPTPEPMPEPTPEPSVENPAETDLERGAETVVEVPLEGMAEPLAEPLVEAVTEPFDDGGVERMAEPVISQENAVESSPEAQSEPFKEQPVVMSDGGAEAVVEKAPTTGGCGCSQLPMDGAWGGGLLLLLLLLFVRRRFGLLGAS
ncbi:MAG: TIGR03790 family protein [Myxococcales bacterium]|nr:TIGR03790 family protein [Myxococcales bacterium]